MKSIKEQRTSQNPKTPSSEDALRSYPRHFKKPPNLLACIIETILLIELSNTETLWLIELSQDQ